MDKEFRVDTLALERAKAREGERTLSFADSIFDIAYADGMGLVEETADYLDGAGRRDLKGLSGDVTVLYAAESMRLTARLLDIASWLMIARALKRGEINSDEAKFKRQRVKLQMLGRPSHTPGFASLPSELQRLVGESFAILERVIRIDASLGSVPEMEQSRTDRVSRAERQSAQIIQFESAVARVQQRT